MAFDETIPPAQSPFNSSSQASMREAVKTTPARMGHLLARKQRIDRWAHQGRGTSISSTALTSASTLNNAPSQKRSESLFSQTNRKLHIRLLQMSEQRQKVIDQHNFDQKLFANKQALKHKENPAVLSTLNYVRKCCKYVDRNETEENTIDPAIFLEENAAARRSRSRSPSATPPPVKRALSSESDRETSASLAETFIRHNRKHLESYRSSPTGRKLAGSRASSTTPTTTIPSETPPLDDETQKRHVQFRIHSENGKSSTQHPISAFGIRSTSAAPTTRTSNSAPLVRTISSSVQSTHESLKSPSDKPKRSLTRIRSAHNALQEFRHHPERFLSSSNRYLPLLRRQAIDMETKELLLKQQREKMELIKRHRRAFASSPPSRLSDGSDMTYDDAKSFLSEETEFGKNTPTLQAPYPVESESRKGSRKPRPSSKIDLMGPIIDDSSERQLAIARLRDREYAHLHELIRSNSIEEILEPLSAMKTDEQAPIDAEEKKRLNYKQQSTTVPVQEVTPLKIRQLGEILHSIDSLRCSDASDRRARRQVDLEKNRAKLGILIF